jgi:IS30 family transposase
MARRYRRLCAAQERELWARWKRGESVRSIERGLSLQPKALQGVVARHGGIAPAPRTRAPRVLSLGEREEISRGLAAGQSLRAIARGIGRAPSTISREIARHGGGRLRYRAERADRRAWHRARRPKGCRLAAHPRLRAVVAAQLAEQWSPQQIAGWLVTAYPDDPTMRLSPETIYRSLYLQARGVLKKELIAHLRRRRPLRRSRHATGAGQGRGQIVDAIAIAARPPTVEDRAIPGHWEGDLLAGGKQSHLATLVERASRFVVLVKVPGKDTTSVVTALIQQVQQLPAALRTSLTWDRGPELAQHTRFTLATDMAVYFCDPQSPWQRGSNENTNGLLRQYFPHGMDLEPFDQAALDRVAHQLNTRPRKTLGYRTPAATFAAYVASTG